MDQGNKRHASAMECGRAKMSELKPCPFCGGEAELMVGKYYGTKWVECKTCHAESDAFDTRAEAIDAWNRRAE